VLLLARLEEDFVRLCRRDNVLGRPYFKRGWHAAERA
jgi:hypothetical protein